MNGIPVSAQLAPLVVAGAKTQTRRLSGLEAVNAAPDDWDRCFVPATDGLCWVFIPKKGALSVTAKPRYHVGQRLAMLTTWATHFLQDQRKPKDIPNEISMDVFWHAGLNKGRFDGFLGKSRPGRFLPNHLRPLMPQLEITAVRCERLKEILEADAIADGVEKNLPIPPADWTAETFGWLKYPVIDFAEDFPATSAVESFATLWDSINAKTMPWARNPWVWVYIFKLCTP